MTVSFAVLTLVGCKNVFEDNDTTLDGSTPFNTVNAPSANNIYQASEPFKIESTFSDKDMVDEIDIKIVRLGSDVRGSQNIVDFKRRPKINTYKLDTTLVANRLPVGDYQMLIRSVDSRKNEGSKEVKFSVK
jgi:hypothetical protein